MLAQRITQLLEQADVAHDIHHIRRVVNISRQIGQSIHADLQLVETLAYLHEVGDRKVLPNISPEDVLQPLGYSAEDIQQYTSMVKALSWSSEVDLSTFSENQYKAIITVKDADMLDALGAIGIARCMAYSGKHNRPIIDQSPPREHLTKAEYKLRDSTSAINHFHEKLLHLGKDMHTEMGARMAESRLAYMQAYVEQIALETTFD